MLFQKIMSNSVVCVIENVSLGEAQLVMLKNNKSHLCNNRWYRQNCGKGDIATRFNEAQASNPGVIDQGN
jgi:CBS domain-containing protein